MPIFEFVCNECGHPFEELLRSVSDTSEVIDVVRDGSCTTLYVTSFASLPSCE